MTEAEWLTSNEPGCLQQFVPPDLLRRFAIACVRAVVGPPESWAGPRTPAGHWPEVLALAERLADGVALAPEANELVRELDRHGGGQAAGAVPV